MKPVIHFRASSRIYCELLLVIFACAIAFVALAQSPASAAANAFAGTNPNIQRLDLPRALPSATVFVTNTNDNGVGSLRSAVIAANPGDTINFNLIGCPCTITLGSEIAITQSLNIVGTGESQLAISGNNATRVFNNVTADPVSFSRLTIQNGNVTGNGGGIRTQHPLTFTNVTFTGNTSSNFGGAIYNEGGIVMLINSTVTGNSASSGGGIGNYSGSTIVVSSTIANNSVGNYGGGIYNRDTLAVTNSTIYSNTAGSIGGGLENESSGNATVINSTFSSNSAGSGKAIYNVTGIPSGVVTLTNTIITNSSTTFNCYSGITNGGHNIDIGTSCGWGTSSGSMSSTDPLLGPLANNGGPTQTMALLAGSPAIDAGDDTVCAAAPVNNLDQRGAHRTSGAHCDIGAYEVQRLIYLPLILK